MANKKEYSRTEERFDLEISHPDIVSMMNDDDVLLNGGEVDTDQAFQVILRKENGTEIVLKEMTGADTLVFRFTKVTIAEDTTELGVIDIES